MVTGYVSQVKPYKSSGDCIVSVEVIREQWMKATALNLEKVIVLTENEYYSLINNAGSEIQNRKGIDNIQ